MHIDFYCYYYNWNWQFKDLPLLVFCFLQIPYPHPRLCNKWRFQLWGTQSVTAWMGSAQSQTTCSVLVFWKGARTHVRVTQEIQWWLNRTPSGSSLVLLVGVMAALGLISLGSTPECPVTSPGSTPRSAPTNQALWSLNPVGKMLTAVTSVLLSTPLTQIRFLIMGRVCSAPFICWAPCSLWCFLPFKELIPTIKGRVLLAAWVHVLFVREIFLS